MFVLVTTTLTATYSIDIDSISTIAYDSTNTEASTVNVDVTPTDTFTSNALSPSSIIVDEITPPDVTRASLIEVPTGIPSSLPKVLEPPGGAIEQPANTSLVQIGFQHSLNYPFVLANELSQKQIFTYMASAISYSLQLPEVNVTVYSIRAFDTTRDLQYISTLLLFFVPSHHTRELRSQIQNPDAAFYNNPDPSVKRLASMVNPGLPFSVQKEDSNTDTTATATIPSPTATALAASSSGLRTDTKIAIAVSIPTSIVMLLLIGLFFWRRRKYVRHQSVKPNSAEKGIDEIVRELSPDPRTFELQTGNYDQELPTEGRERLEVHGDQRWRQELSGSEIAQEIMSHRRSKRPEIQ